MAVIDLIIVGFACMSLAVFAATKDKEECKEKRKPEQSEQSEESRNQEK